ncbi:TPA: hypothetical protein DCX15_02950 [bacterium]|nr:hypothetical protein [bacterium]
MIPKKMQQEDYLTELLKFQGFFVVDMEIKKDEDIKEAILVLDRVERKYSLWWMWRDTDHLL